MRTSLASVRAVRCSHQQLGPAMKLLGFTKRRLPPTRLTRLWLRILLRLGTFQTVAAEGPQRALACEPTQLEVLHKIISRTLYNIAVTPLVQKCEKFGVLHFLPQISCFRSPPRRHQPHLFHTSLVLRGALLDHDTSSPSGHIIFSPPTWRRNSLLRSLRSRPAGTRRARRWALVHTQ